MLNYRSAEMNADQLEEKFPGGRAGRTHVVHHGSRGDSEVWGRHPAHSGDGRSDQGQWRRAARCTTAHMGLILIIKIRILDKLQVPGPEDLQEVASRVKESKEAPFALCADIKQAHRNVKVRESDWPKLGASLQVAHACSGLIAWERLESALQHITGLACLLRLGAGLSASCILISFTC